jgi:hypothetical protein
MASAGSRAAKSARRVSKLRRPADADTRPPRRLAAVPRVQPIPSRRAVARRVTRQPIRSRPDARRVTRQRARSCPVARQSAVGDRSGWSRGLRRAAVFGLPVILVGTLASGCSGFDKSFGEREAIVTFREGTSQAVRMAVRSACSHVPQAIPEPVPTDKKLSDYLNDVRYRIDKASDADLARLENCLGKFPSVSGVETPQDEDS